MKRNKERAAIEIDSAGCKFEISFGHHKNRNPIVIGNGVIAL